MLVAGNFLKFGCITIAGMLLSRNYSKSELGTYLQGVLLIATISEIAAWGLPKAILFFGGIEKNRKNLILHILIMIGFTASLFGLLLWGLRDRIGNLFSNPALKDLAFVMILNLLFRTMNIALSTIMVIIEKVNFMTAIYVASSVINVATFAVLAHLKSPVINLFLCSFLLEAFQLILFLCVFLFAGKTIGYFQLDTKLMGRILAYSSPMMVNVLIIMAGRKLDSFLVSGFFVPEDYAVYSRGALELPFSQMILVSIASLLMPEFSRLFHNKRHFDLTQLLSHEILKISLLIFPMFFGLLLVHRDLIVFLYSEKYVSSATVFLVYVLLVPIQLYAFDSILQAFNKTIWVNVASVAYVLTNLGIGLALIPYLGVLGPAIGVLCGTLVNSVINLFLINKFLGNRFGDWLPWKNLGRVLFLSGIPVFFIWPIARFLPTNIFERLCIESSVYYSSALAILWHFKGIPAEYRESIVNMYKRKKLGFSRG